MSLLEFLIMLLISGVCGAIAQSLVGRGGRGCVTSVALGFIGAMIGAWFSREMGLPEPLLLELGGRPFPVVWSIIGASLFVAVLALLTGSAAD